MKLKNIQERLFYQALRIRLVEERIIALYPSDKIQSPVHLSIGQEAVAVGLCAALKNDDIVFGTYRSHALYLAKGGSLKSMFAELYGRIGGCAGGKAGSMHLLAPEDGFMGASAIVASTIPHAVGAALAIKRQRRKEIVVSVFGDGATEEGVYHESLNFANLHKLPVLFVCENNRLAINSRIEVRQSYRITRHAGVYGIPAIHLRAGYDAFKVYEACRKATNRVREKRTPCFMEIDTCRYKEHVGIGDHYEKGNHSNEEINRWKRKDPLILDEKRVFAYSPYIEKEIDAAVRFAEQSPAPESRHLLKDVL